MGKTSFYDWCMVNNRQDLIDAWDCQLNQEDIKSVPFYSREKYYFKIEENMPSILYSPSNIRDKRRSNDPIKIFYNSFGYYLIKNFGDDAIEKYWSDKNDKSPFEYSVGSGFKVWIKCQNCNYHEDYQMACFNFIKGKRCPWCAGKMVHPLDSFAQYNINRLGDDFLERYWCKDNNINPWTIRPFVNKVKVKIQCQHKSYHQYWVEVADFSLGIDCPLCNKKRVHYIDSLGGTHPELIPLWSDKNEKSIFEYREFSHEKVYWKCKDGKHDDYIRAISDITSKGFYNCPNCTAENNMSWYQRIVGEYLDTMPYKINHENNCTLCPINPYTNYPLRYDNEVCNINGHNLIVEVHGIQHYQENGFHILGAKHSGRTVQEEYEYQIWKDKYKEQYAIENGYEYLAIPYYDINNGNYIDIIDRQVKLLKQ